MRNLLFPKFIVTLLFICLGLGTILASVDSLDIESYIEKHQLEVQQSPDGIAYIIDKETGYSKVRTGDYVLIHYKAMRLDEFVFDESSAKEGFVFQVGYRQVIPGLDKGLQLMCKGEKARLLIPSNLAYGKQGAGEAIKPDMDLLYEVEVAKVLNAEEYDQYIIALEEKERKAYGEHIKKQFLKDKKLIQDYVLAQEWRTKRTQSGLSYVITKEGKGDYPVPGDIVHVSYEGKLADGTIFDTTPEDNQYTFKLGIGKVIKGWDEGLTYFREGGEGFLLIPSKLAYGPRPIKEKDINIPADAVLIFELKLDKIQKAGQVNTARKN